MPELMPDTLLLAILFDIKDREADRRIGLSTVVTRVGGAGTTWTARGGDRLAQTAENDPVLLDRNRWPHAGQGLADILAFRL